MLGDKKSPKKAEKTAEPAVTKVKKAEADEGEAPKAAPVEASGEAPKTAPVEAAGEEKTTEEKQEN